MFRRKRNPSRAAAVVIPGLEEFLSNYAEQLWSTLQGDSEKAGSAPQAFILEVVCFSVHVLDRLSFARLGPERRGPFVDAIIEGLFPFAERHGFEQRSFVDLWNTRQREWSSYNKLLGGEGEPLKDTACWEFAKAMAAQFDVWNPVCTSLLAIGATHSIEAGALLLDIVEGRA